jgi:hypothetical protein
MTIGIEQGSQAMEDLLALVQAGVRVECESGMSAREFMREALGLDDDYIEHTISTLFIDSEPVDDIDAAQVRSGSCVALSAAMPGLVGAVMRRGSPYASFRAGISHGSSGSIEDSEGATSKAGLVQVKYFNAVMRDRGPSLLERGVLVPYEEAAALARGHGLSPPAPARSDGLEWIRIVAKSGVKS